MFSVYICETDRRYKSLHAINVVNRVLKQDEIPLLKQGLHGGVSGFRIEIKELFSINVARLMVFGQVW